MKVHIEIYGCTANKADADTIKNLLSENYQISNFQESDLVIVLTCGVKGPTENKILERLRKIKGKKIIIAGCLPRIIGKKLKKEFPHYSLVGVDQVQDIENICKRVLNGEIIEETEHKPKKLIQLKKINETQPILIAEGCTWNCTYCAAKLARGNLKSFQKEEIVKLVKYSVNNGAKKILLTAQDTGCYGFDIETNLPALLNEVVKIDGDFKIRVGMMNPYHTIKIVDELIEIYKNPKIIKFIHIPIQAGSNNVLKTMNRIGTVEDFENIVNKFRKNIPNITIVTDIIVGFPEETEEQFQETASLIKRIKPEVLNISKFYARPGTKAKEMKQLPSETIKKRSTELSKIYKELITVNKHG